MGAGGMPPSGAQEWGLQASARSLVALRSRIKKIVHLDAVDNYSSNGNFEGPTPGPPLVPARKSHHSSRFRSAFPARPPDSTVGAGRSRQRDLNRCEQGVLRRTHLNADLEVSGCVLEGDARLQASGGGWSRGQSGMTCVSLVARVREASICPSDTTERKTYVLVRARVRCLHGATRFPVKGRSLPPARAVPLNASLTRPRASPKHAIRRG